MASKPPSAGKTTAKRASAAGAHAKPRTKPVSIVSAQPNRGRSNVTVRHYCQGIGDCHLLKFKTKNEADFWMLIDCGIHSSVTGGPAMVKRIVADIASVTNRLDVVVVTHEHWDHVSGFLTEAEAFKKFNVGEVWMGWTEDASDPQARQLDKFKQQALAALQTTSAALDRAPALSPYLSALHFSLDAVLGFNFGAKGERVRDARNAAAALAKDKVRYREPKDAPIAIASLPDLRIYVLGPPRDATLLGLTQKSSEMYAIGEAFGWPIARMLTDAFGMNAGSAGDSGAPFDANIGTDLTALLRANEGTPKDVDPEIAAFAREHYTGPARVQAHKTPTGRTRAVDPNEADQSWRRIDHDWLGVGADLAMQIDDRTNNTSLALAFEFVKSGRVLLFAADAQVGSWLSWQNLSWTVDGKTVSGPDLLSRAVYYKVGHHGSENATLKAKGLELMTSKDLSAFIPTNEKDAKKVGWGQMPFASILKALEERCGGRVIRADDSWVASPQIPAALAAPSGSTVAIRHCPDLWVELQIE